MRVPIKKSALLAAAFLAASALGSTLASPAQDLYDQVIFDLTFNYGGFSKADLKSFDATYQPKLNAACAATKDACPYSAAVPIIEEMVKAVGDGHTNYYTADQYRSFARSVTGAGAGAPRIGLAHEQVEGSTDRRVIDVVEDSPSEKAGVKRGDIITAFNGVKPPADDAEARKVLGELVASGKPVRLSIMRGGKPIEISVTGALSTIGRRPSLRPLESDKTIGVLRIPDFEAAETIGPSIHDLVRKAQVAGYKALVVDLRDDGGGISTECLSGVSAFVPDVARQRVTRFGQTEDGFRAGVVYSRDSKGREAQSYSIENPAHWTGPLAVLVNKNSASCAEYFASDIQFAKRGPVIGEQTYGLGNTGTQILPLIDGSGLQVTITRAVRLDGTPYPEFVTPDIVVKDDLDVLSRTGHDMPLERAVQELTKLIK